MEERGRGPDIAGLSRDQLEPDDAAYIVGDSGDIGGPAASTAPDRLLCRRPFPPALRRWALQCRRASPGFNS